MAAAAAPEWSRGTLLMWLLRDTCDTTEHKTERYALYTNNHEPIYYRSLVKRLQMLDQLLEDMLADPEVFTLTQLEIIRNFTIDFHGLADFLIQTSESSDPPSQEVIDHLRDLTQQIANLIRNNGPAMWQGHLPDQAQG